ncbi:hcp [Dickeya dadantii 3937]|uniref:Hcp n=1 Tax=Dickeya dadantii (strain 3937) TaxID=198628 RepID=E0SK74_DICD3|nr:hcp [Dickeya dadantii 3937]
MPTPCYISIEGKTQGNITADAFTSDSVGNIYQQGDLHHQRYRFGAPARQEADENQRHIP